MVLASGCGNSIVGTVQAPLLVKHAFPPGIPLHCVHYMTGLLQFFSRCDVFLNGPQYKVKLAHERVKSSRADIVDDFGLQAGLCAIEIPRHSAGKDFHYDLSNRHLPRRCLHGKVLVIHLCQGIGGQR